MRPASCSRRITSRISVVVKPNFAASPPDFSHFPEPFRIKLDADADHRQFHFGIDARYLLGEVERMVELAHLFDHDDDVLSRSGTGECKADKIAVLEPVEHQQAFFRLFEPECGVKLRLRTRLEAEIISRAFPEVLFDHGPVLVDLHRIDAEMAALVFEFLYGLSKEFEAFGSVQI